jgi:hypothetical protein
MIPVSIETRKAIRYLEAVKARALPRAVGATLRRVGTTTRQAAQVKIREEVVLKAGDLKKAITIERVPRSLNPDQLYIDLRARGGPIPIAQYQARQTKRGVTYRVRRGEPKKVYRRGGRAGFIIGTGSGRSFSPDSRFGGQVFTSRPAPGPDPIKRAYGPGIAQRFKTRSVQRVIRETFRREFPKRLIQELRFQISKVREAR